MLKLQNDVEPWLGLRQFIDHLIVNISRLRTVSSDVINEFDLLAILETAIGYNDTYKDLRSWMMLIEPGSFDQAITYFKKMIMDALNKIKNVKEKIVNTKMENDESKSKRGTEEGNYAGQSNAFGNHDSYHGRDGGYRGGRGRWRGVYSNTYRNNNNYQRGGSSSSFRGGHGNGRPFNYHNNTNHNYSIYNNDKSDQQRPFTCFNCGGINHKSINCMAPKKYFGNQNQPQSNNEQNSEMLFAEESVNAVNDNNNLSQPVLKIEDIYLDSGASNHIFGNSKLLHNIKKFDSPISVVVANGNTVNIEVFGEVKLKGLMNNVDITISNVRSCSLFPKNLLSVSQLVNRGLEVVFTAKGAVVKRGSNILMKANKVNNMFVIQNEQIILSKIQESIYQVQQVNVSNLWHNRLGHCGFEKVKYMESNKIVDGIENPIVNNENNQRLNCIGCALGKSKREVFHNYSSRVSATQPLMRIFHDNSGPVRIPDLDNPKIKKLYEVLGTEKYLSLIIDEYSGYIIGKPIYTKDQAVQHIKDTIIMEENQTGCHVKIINADDSGEFRTTDLIRFLQDKGIKRNLTNKDTPQQNAMVERGMRTVFEPTRAMLQHANLHPVFWGYAVLACIVALNFIPTYRDTSKSRTELYYRYKPSVKKLRVFGCDAIVHILKQDRNSKVEQTAIKCIFLGYDDLRENGYIFLNPENLTIVNSRDAIFKENEFTYGRDLLSNNMKNQSSNSEIKNNNRGVSWNSDVTIVHDNVNSQMNDNDRIAQPVLVFEQEDKQDDIIEIMDEYKESNMEMNVNSSESSNLNSQVHLQGETQNNNKSAVNNQRRSSRNRRPAEYSNMIPSNLFHFYAQEENSNILKEQYHLVEEGPTNYNQAMERPDANEWTKACETELKSHEKNNSWTLVKRTEAMHVIPGRWVFVIKIDPNSGERTYKARYVVKGFKQWNGVDYFDDQVSSSVLSAKSLRIILTITASNGHELHQMDAVSAFTQAELQEEIYAKQPEGFVVGKDMVCKLNKAVYGLKQASYLWQQSLRKFMLNNNWNSCILDDSVYFRYSKTNHLIMIGTYVDDILSSYHPEDKTEFMEFVELIKNKFTLKEIGEPEAILGMKLYYDKSRKIIKLDHCKYIEEMLKTYRMENSNSNSTPASEELLGPEHCPTMDSDRYEMKKYPYRNLIGELLYLAHSSRPDISYSVGVLSRFMENPGKKHWEAAKRILRYLRGNKN